MRFEQLQVELFSLLRRQMTEFPVWLIPECLMTEPPVVFLTVAEPRNVNQRNLQRALVILMIFWNYVVQNDIGLFDVFCHEHSQILCSFIHIVSVRFVLDRRKGNVIFEQLLSSLSYNLAETN